MSSSSTGAAPLTASALKMCVAAASLTPDAPPASPSAARAPGPSRSLAPGSSPPSPPRSSTLSALLALSACAMAAPPASPQRHPHRFSSLRLALRASAAASALTPGSAMRPSGPPHMEEAAAAAPPLPPPPPPAASSDAAEHATARFKDVRVEFVARAAARAAAPALPMRLPARLRARRPVLAARAAASRDMTWARGFGWVVWGNPVGYGCCYTFLPDGMQCQPKQPSGSVQDRMVPYPPHSPVPPPSLPASRSVAPAPHSTSPPPKPTSTSRRNFFSAGSCPRHPFALLGPPVSVVLVVHGPCAARSHLLVIKTVLPSLHPQLPQRAVGGQGARQGAGHAGPCHSVERQVHQAQGAVGGQTAAQRHHT